MSSRPLLLCALFVLGASPLAAQASTQDQLVARLSKTSDSLAGLWREAQSLAQLQDSLAHAATVGRIDTIQVQSIRIISNRSSLPLREGAEQIWPVFDSLYGDDAAGLAAIPVSLQAIPDDTVRRRRYWATPVREGTSVAEIVGILRGTLALPPPDSSFNAWLPGSVRPAVFGLDNEASDSYVSLVASSPVIGPRCFNGDIDACIAVLRLRDGDSATRMAAYPTLRDRQDVVARLEGWFRQRRDLSGMLECRNGSDEVCTSLILRVPRAQLPHPIETQARSLLVHLALLRGGRQAYRRLSANPDAAIGERLAHAANMPLDSLVADWRRTVLAARPAPVSLPPSNVLAVVMWILLFGYFGVRSSRWRPV